MKLPLGRESPSKLLVLTERGERWLSNFEDEDKACARDLVSHLTLVSATEFERGILKIIDSRAEGVQGPVALFGVRELDVKNGERIFNEEGGAVNATPRGPDIGSEGRVAAILRNHARTRPDKFLNHPSIDEMRKLRCDLSLFVDDFIGSGDRVDAYLKNFYGNPTIRSWHSYGAFKAELVVYSGTPVGITRMQRVKMKPKLNLVRSCPTLDTLLRKPEERAEFMSLCTRYAKVKKLGYPLGYGGVGALLVFEHSCPNNCPKIFWGGSVGGKWEALFPGKAVVTEARSIFPNEILSHEPVHVLIAAGERRIAESARVVVLHPLPAAWLATLALFGKGIRRVDAVEAATGLTHDECLRIIEQCITAGLLTQRWRLADMGRAELRASQKAVKPKKVLPIGNDEAYYPVALRRHANS